MYNYELTAAYLETWCPRNSWKLADVLVIKSY